MRFKFLTPVLLLFIVACNQEIEINHANIAGVWKASIFDAEVTNLSSADKASGEKEFLSSVYTLNADQTMEIHSDYFKDGVKGLWEIDPKTNEISMTYKDGENEALEKYTVKSLTKNKIVLRQEINANDYKGYVEITFTK
jgi:hypothetical protein